MYSPRGMLIAASEALGLTSVSLGTTRENDQDESSALGCHARQHLQLSARGGDCLSRGSIMPPCTRSGEVGTGGLATYSRRSRLANNSLMLTRLAGGNAVAPRLPSCPRMEADGLSRLAA